ncbi:hypothetical protein F5B22DRAFT_324536 [Xylaria bambusicola]|uniref:uncharacterized protein n=1 Tax=Xylaria bambusicola TaxID=326684 RepID=UPI002008B24F|nr:uncharacterized protein F5B22DRAFT_324536 [Xylaria bambusicola]KAI0509530.1 hypothetical protein F5B22DRAFT_324536 [Xylaria bambusicola]
MSYHDLCSPGLGDEGETACQVAWALRHSDRALIIRGSESTCLEPRQRQTDRLRDRHTPEQNTPSKSPSPLDTKLPHQYTLGEESIWPPSKAAPISVLALLRLPLLSQAGRQGSNLPTPQTQTSPPPWLAFSQSANPSNPTASKPLEIARDVYYLRTWEIRATEREKRGINFRSLACLLAHPRPLARSPLRPPAKLSLPCPRPTTTIPTCNPTANNSNAQVR